MEWGRRALRVGMAVWGGSVKMLWEVLDVNVVRVVSESDGMKAHDDDIVGGKRMMMMKEEEEEGEEDEEDVVDEQL